MREIKFRVWNPRDKKIHYDITGFEFYNDGTMSGVFIDGAFFLLEEVELMQYTGLHDKNGKEIYEGDIVEKETFDDTKPNCIAKSYAKVMYIEELAGFYLVYKNNKILWEVSQDKYNIAVVSTIYDNPELLEVSQ